MSPKHFSDEQIRRTLVEMGAKALALGMVNGEVVFALDFPGDFFLEYKMTIGKIHRDPRDGDPGRNYAGGLELKVAFCRRTKRDSGKYPDEPIKLCETDLQGCIIRPFGTGWIFFGCSGLPQDADDKIVAEEGFATLLMRS